MNPKKTGHYTNKTQSEIFNISQLSVQKLHQALSNNPSLINTIDNSGETLLSYALKKNNNKIYELLLNSPFLFLNFQDQDGNSYLHLSVKNQNEKIIKNLIEKGININLQNKLGNTALHIAYEIGNNSIIKYLLEHGTNRLIKNKNNLKADEIKNNIVINKNASVNNYNKLCNNKSITQLKIGSQNTNILKSAKKDENKNNSEINNLLIKENGGKYQDNYKFNIYSKTNKNPKYIIKKNNKEKDIALTESNNNNTNTNSTISKEKGKKNLKIKIDFEKLKKGSLYNIFSLKDNNNKNNKENVLFENNTNQKTNEINYTERGHKIVSNINKKINNLEESSSSFLESSDSRKRDNKEKNMNSINEYEYTNYKEKIQNKKRDNNKRTNFRNNFYNLGDINNLEKWNTIQIKKSPRAVKDKNKEEKEKNIRYKGSVAKRNSPRKNYSLYSTNMINKTIHTSRSKNKTNKDSFILNKNNKIKKIERYYNDDINNQINIDDEKLKTIEQKDYIIEKEINFNNNYNNYLINDKSNKKKKNSNITSVHKILNKSEENILAMKSSKLLKDFLFQINMDHYLDILAMNGFDDINLILDQSKNGGTSIQDNELKEAGISIPGDRAKILIRIQELSNNFPFPVPKEVYHKNDDINKIENDENIQKLKKWLEKLKVEDYLINFIYSGYHSIELLLMQMISYNPLTSEMLKEEIGIDKIGYRSRIINKLKDEARSFLGQLKTKTLVINKGEENTNNCQCIIF